MYDVKINTSTGVQSITGYSLINCSLNRFYDSDSIRLRTKVDGGIIFYGSAYAELQKLRDAGKLQTELYIELNNVRIYSGQLQLQGIWKANENLCELSVLIDDEYTLLLKNIDREFAFGTANEASKTQVQCTEAFQIQSVNELNVTGVFPDQETAWCNEYYTSDAINVYNPEHYYKAIRNLGKDNNDRIYYSGDNRSYSRVGAQTFAALKTGILVSPTDTEQREWVEVFSTDSGFPKMRQITAPITFANSILSDYNDLWVLGSCGASLSQQWYFGTANLKDALAFALDEVDNSITMGAWDLGNIFVYPNLATSFKLKLSEVIDIYKTLFNVDWRLENGEFWFRTFTESQPKQPTSYTNNEFQYIDRVFSKDWSTDIFSFDIKDKVHETSVEVDLNPSYADFGKSVIKYDTFFEDTQPLTNSSFVLDIAQLTTSREDGIAVIKQDGAGFMINGYGLDGIDFYVYNLGLSLYELMKNDYKYGRPFNLGELSLNGWAFKQEIDLIADYNKECEINIPYINPFVIDFSLYLKTSFGDLKCIEMKTNLSSAITVITGGKQ